jgi:hypothetical protein
VPAVSPLEELTAVQTIRHMVTCGLLAPPFSAAFRSNQEANQGSFRRQGLQVGGIWPCR